MNLGRKRKPLSRGRRAKARERVREIREKACGGEEKVGNASKMSLGSGQRIECDFRDTFKSIHVPGYSVKKKKLSEMLEDYL